MRDTKNYMSLPYNPALKERARELRRAGNLAEVLLWNQLKRNQFLELDFDRQKIIGNYIVDFYCHELMLAIEIDGDSHLYKYEYDRFRQGELEKLGVHFLRFSDIDVKQNLFSVLLSLEQEIERLKTPLKSPQGDNPSN